MVKKKNNNKSSEKKRAYGRSDFHHKHCPVMDSHDLKCHELEGYPLVPNRSDSPKVDEAETTTKSGKATTKGSTKKSGSGKTTKASSKTKKEAVQIPLGDLNDMKSGAFVYEIDEGIHIVGFDIDVDKVNANYTKFNHGSEADSVDYENGELVLHYKNGVDFQIHNKGIGTAESGEEYYNIVVPKLADFDYSKISLGDILDEEQQIGSF